MLFIAFFTVTFWVEVLILLSATSSPSATSTASPTYPYFGMVIVSPGTPCRLASTAANGVTLILFGSLAEIMSAITSGSISCASFVMFVSAIVSTLL